MSAKHLKPQTATLLVVATMIGTGVFTTSGFLLRDLGSEPAVLLAWLVGGLASGCGALAYAELVAALPHNGGEYQLLKRIYHPAIGFVAGFTSLVVGFAAPIAASALAFGEYLNLALGMELLAPSMAGAILILAASIQHTLRLETGSRLQDLFTLLKILLLLLFILGGLWSGSPQQLLGDGNPPVAQTILSPAFAVALIYISYAYSGWNAAAYVAGEVQDPGRWLPVALLLGTLLVTLLYLGVNAVFLAAAPADQLAAANERVGHVAASALLGEAGGRLLSALIALGLVSMVGALVMTGPRVYEAMGYDYPTIALLARRRHGGGPVLAIALQSGLALLMLWTSTFEALVSYAGLTLSIFTALTVAGVFVLRHREPMLQRPYRTWSHPFTTLAFILLMAWMILHAIHERPLVVLSSAVTIGSGWLIYRLVRGQQGAA
ncbi:amino acid permease [Caldichromatium japonicum]|uniref:Amino acid permease n=1 Tax=Caldichromatium japonicum TaxID=2699430 RepID=A0A6G7VGH5_9GAMM|nr:amino acid permease [Caldichromatium japonicum]QIK39010.1 amino acid permease [Caldichromatium japonicum]